MGHMINGVYHADDGLLVTKPSGEWQRARSVVRNWITADGSAGPTGEGGFKAEADRYHLFVAWNCPWAHRTLLTRVFKKLEGLISISVTRPNRNDQGWIFDAEGEFSDPLLQLTAVHEVYSRDPQPYTGRLTVPVLWDIERGQMVSNESADIVRMFNSAFVDIAPSAADLCPGDLIADIETWNERIYRTINNGVYRAGFASTQEAYAAAAFELFENLDLVDRQLSKTRYLTGDTFSEADVRLFPTLARFDVAYHYAFKCNLKRLVDYQYLWPYAREIYQITGVASTVRFDIYKRGYFSKSDKRNPLGIVPIGPVVDWSAPHGR